MNAIYSIDQNCHSLWDVPPKLDALARRGWNVSHFIEDVDVAFTSMSAQARANELRLAPERFHRSGGSDWGAAVFYFQFLGRQPVELRDLEPFTGMKTVVLAKRLGRSVDDLYEEFSPSDNWQLIGPSYAGRPGYHRGIGDLSTAETGPFLRQLMDRAEADMLHSFPGTDSQQRIAGWFAGERALLAKLLGDCANGRLIDVYRRWLGEYLGERVQLELSSRLFACGASAEHTSLLEVFTRQYDLAAGLYNQAIEKTGVKLRPLAISRGELPFFASLSVDGHQVRTGVSLCDGRLVVGGRDFALGAGGALPTREMARAGITSLVGKAMLLVLQVRIGESGRPLALPYRGSLYMPAADRLAEELARAGLLPGRLKPVVRVRFRLLDRLRSLQTPIRIPEYLRRHFGTDVIPACRLGESYASLLDDARRRLELFRTRAGREQWQEQNLAELLAETDQLDALRRDLAARDPKGPGIREVWKQIRDRRARMLDATLRRIIADYHVTEIDYWDSRGAIRPWAVALGGQEFYDELIDNAEIYEEPVRRGDSNG